MAQEIVTVTKKTADIYPNESFFMDITRKDGQVFASTNTFDVEIRNNLGETIDTKAMQLSTAKTEFEIRYFDTTEWEVGKEYKLLGRLKDTETKYNDVVLEVLFTVK